MIRARLLVALGLLLGLLVPSSQTSAAFSATTSSNASLTTNAYTPPSCINPEILADNPAGYWRLNETSGTSAADSKGTNTGTYAGGYTLNSAGALGDPANRSVAFNGSNANVTVPNSASIQTADTFTWEAWIRLAGQNATNNYRTIMSKEGTAYFGVNTDGQVEFYNLTTGVRVAGTYTKITDTKWHHVALVKLGTDYGIYIDGVYSAIGYNAPGTVASSTNPLLIGGRNTQYFNGNIDEVAVYSTILGFDRINAHFNAGRCYRDEPRADAATAIWRMGENLGDAEAFDSQGSNVGTYNNGPTLQRNGLVEYESNTAVEFDGVDDRIDVPDSAALKITGNMTLETWFKLDALPATGATRIIGKGGAGTRNYGIWVRNDGWIDFNQCTASCGTTMVVSAPAGTIQAGKTYHVAATLSGTTRTLYVNGSQVGQTTTTGTVTTSTEPLVIGKSDQTGPYTDGIIDDAAIYSSALSATRVRDHYVAGRSYKNATLDAGASAYWRLGEPSGTTAIDQLGTSNGTYSGGATPFIYTAPAGEFDYSRYFDGTDDQVTLSNPSAIQSSSGTMEAWLWTNNSGGAIMDIFNKGSAYGMFMFNNTFQTYDYTAAAFRNSNVAINGGRWTHVAMTFQSGVTNGTILYVNGTAVLTTTITVSSQAGGGAIGAYPTQQYLQGTIDEVAFYKRVLSPAEMATRYALGLKQPR